MQAEARFAGPDRIVADGTGRAGEALRDRHPLDRRGADDRGPRPGSLPDQRDPFDLTVLPGSAWWWYGGGPIGLEMAQAHARLGSRVTVLERDRLLPRRGRRPYGPAARRAQPATAWTSSKAQTIRRVEPGEGEPVGGRSGAGARRRRRGSAGIAATHLLVAGGPPPGGRRARPGERGAGRRESARPGSRSDARLRTTNRRIFAVGDVAGAGPQFTHLAGYHAGIVIRNALFPPSGEGRPGQPAAGHLPGPGNWPRSASPKGEAREAGHDPEVLTWPFEEESTGARALRETEGLIKVVLGRRGRILGAGIAGPQDGRA